MGWRSAPRPTLRHAAAACKASDDGSKHVRATLGVRARGNVRLAGGDVALNAHRTGVPHYDVMLAWNPEAMPADWEAGRTRYFTINWIQFATTWAAFTLFLVALISL